jgi:DHHC palmitoyltransferase
MSVGLDVCVYTGTGNFVYFSHLFFLRIPYTETRMNNCIGVNNFKHFILFLVYTWIGSVLALIIFAVNYFFCNSSECQFNDNAVEISLVRVMTLICIVTVLFTSSMLMNVIYGITTGIGTIDRLKKKADDQWHLAMEEPIPLRDIVGISTSRITVGGCEQVVARLADWWWWFLPVDPQFDDYDRVMGYATAVRLLREQQQQHHHQQQQQQSSPAASSTRFPISPTPTGATTTSVGAGAAAAGAAPAPVLSSQTTISSASSSGPRNETQASI